MLGTTWSVDICRTSSNTKQTQIVCLEYRNAFSAKSSVQSCYGWGVGYDQQTWKLGLHSSLWMYTEVLLFCIVGLLASELDYHFVLQPWLLPFVLPIVKHLTVLIGKIRIKQWNYGFSDLVLLGKHLIQACVSGDWLFDRLCRLTNCLTLFRSLYYRCQFCHMVNT